MAILLDSKGQSIDILFKEAPKPISDDKFNKELNREYEAPQDPEELKKLPPVPFNHSEYGNHIR